MCSRPAKPTAISRHAAILACCALLAGCSHVGDEASRHAEEAGDSAPARGVVRLTAEAQAAFGIETAPAVRRRMPKTLPTTGWLVTPPGRATIVKAGANGFFLPAVENKPLEVGAVVGAGERLGSLRVFLSPQEEAQLVIAKEEADIAMKQALVSLQLAEEQLKRLEANETRLAVAGVRLFELQEIAQRNRVAFEEAREKLPFLPAEPYSDKLELKSVAVESPLSGRISELHVAPRQLVVQGDPLYTVSDWSLLWVKTPVFEGDLPRIPPTSPAVVAGGAGAVLLAPPLASPQPTEAGRRTVDLYYRLDNSSGSFRPGQAVAIGLPVGETQEQIVAPRSAVIWDGMGNTWVYVREGPESFRRQRVELSPGDAEVDVVERGLSGGEAIVFQGAQSLHGEEFQGQLQAGDDD